ncbi:MAG TPA: cupin domain-containing protein [Alphaproteobacteria bacterium]|nr:cupin domain-containing protein [Alphaproteobacteria bacterium]
METFSIADKVEFSDARQVRKRLVMSERIEMEMVCYEPGQQTVEHHHVGQDEIFHILEGGGTVLVAGEPVPVSAGSVVFIPADVKHSVETSDTRLVMVFFKSPGRSARKSSMTEEN